MTMQIRAEGLPFSHLHDHVCDVPFFWNEAKTLPYALIKKKAPDLFVEKTGQKPYNKHQQSRSREGAHTTKQLLTQPITNTNWQHEFAF